MLGLRPRLRPRNSLYDLIERRVADDEKLQRSFEQQLDDSVDDELPPLPFSAAPFSAAPFSRPSTPRTPFSPTFEPIAERAPAAAMAPVSSQSHHTTPARPG